MPCEVTSSKIHSSFTICFVVFVNRSCFVDINAEVLLHFVQLVQTRPFIMQFASVVFSEMSPICHQFRLVLPLHLSPVCSLIASNGNFCTEPFHVCVNCRDWTRHIRKLSRVCSDVSYKKWVGRYRTQTLRFPVESHWS
jgi:hypothetical protein